MTNERRDELIDKIKNVDTEDFSIYLTEDNKLNVNLVDSFQWELFNNDKYNKYIEEIKELAKDCNAEEYVKENELTPTGAYTSSLFDDIGIYDVLDKVSYDVNDQFYIDLQKYLQIPDSEFDDFVKSLFNDEYTITIETIETFPEYLDELLIRNIDEVYDLTDRIEDAISEKQNEIKRC